MKWNIFDMFEKLLIINISWSVLSPEMFTDNDILYKKFL